MELRIAGIERESVVDGPGLRYVIFTQGCHHHCLGCHNPDTHAMDGGKLVAVNELLKDIGAAGLLQGVTFSGGEPFLQAEALVHLGKKLKERGLHIVTYTGFLFEDLVEQAEFKPAYRELLALTDWLIDGPYVARLRTFNLPYRGSANQRIIAVARALADYQSERQHGCPLAATNCINL